VNLVPSLLQAIVRIDGEALVMHPGEKPYVVTSSGQVELASRSLTFDAVTGIVMQLLPVELQHALDDVGAVEYTMPAQADFPHEHFTVVVARGASDVWAEIRRKSKSDGHEIHRDLLRMPEPDTGLLRPPSGQPPGHQEREAEPVAAVDDGLEIPAADQLFAKPTAPEEMRGADSTPPAPTDYAGIEYLHVEYAEYAEAEQSRVERAALDVLGDIHDGDADAAGQDVPSTAPAVDAVAAGQASPFDAVVPRRVAQDAGGAAEALTETPSADLEVPAADREGATAEVRFDAQPNRAAEAVADAAAPAAVADADAPAADAGAAAPDAVETPKPDLALEPSLHAVDKSSTAVVLPMARNPVRAEAPPAPAADALSGLERLLRTAAARGASTLYLSSDARPSVRVDGQLQILDSEPVHAANDVISLLLTLMPERSHEALRTGATTEWICEIEDIGRVRCMSFSDHRGPGGVFRLMPVRTVTVEQLGLPREVQSLAIEPEGLVLVAGPRSSGKRTLISALVDLINRTRRDHVITVEREVNIVHERGSSFISQREVRGSDDEVLAAARAALREDPDVLVLEQVRTGLLMNVALEAAASGHLVIAGFSAHNAAESIDRILDLYAPEYARQVQLALADNLRGVVAQVLLPKIGGGRIAAREVLLNTAAVASVIAEGKTSQLPMAIEGGRRTGMMPLNDALVAYVRNGLVDIGEAYRHVADRPAFVELLKRAGVDTSAVA
jgi:twitching motility protein PilT